MSQLLTEHFGEASEMVFTIQNRFRPFYFLVCADGDIVMNKMCVILSKKLRVSHTLLLFRYIYILARRRTFVCIREGCGPDCKGHLCAFYKQCTQDRRLLSRHYKHGCREFVCEIQHPVRKRAPVSRNPLARLRRQLVVQGDDESLPEDFQSDFDKWLAEMPTGFIPEHYDDDLNIKHSNIPENLPDMCIPTADLPMAIRLKLLGEAMKRMDIPIDRTVRNLFLTRFPDMEVDPAIMDEFPDFPLMMKVRMKKEELCEKFWSSLQGPILPPGGENVLSNVEWYISYLEDVQFYLAATVYYNAQKKRYIATPWTALRLLIKLRFGTSVFSRKFFKMAWDYLSQFRLQSEDESQSWIDWCMNYKNKFDEIRKAPIFEKIYKVIMFVTSFSVCQAVGGVFTIAWFKSLWQECQKHEFNTTGDFISFMIESILFIVKRVAVCISTRSIEPLFHNGSRYEEWYDSVRTLKLQYKFLNDPELHGFTYFDFVSRLDDAIDRGTAMYKHALATKHYEYKLVGQQLFDIKLLKGLALTKENASREREAPFSVCIVGNSSVAKSTFTRLIFYHHGKLLGLPMGSTFMFSRNAENEFWDTFRSSQWAVLLDDVANQHPNKVVGLDKSLSEIILLNNNVPFVPPQASLDDKGTTPVRAKLLIATTNVDHLNANTYFSHPIAIRRRLPWMVFVRPKPEYVTEGGMLDSHKVPPVEEGSYPDYWTIEVKRVVPVMIYEKQSAQYEDIGTFNNIYDFFLWYNKTVLDHEAIQKKAAVCIESLSKIVFCDKCKLPSKHCVCEKLEIQGRTVELKTLAVVAATAATVAGAIYLRNKYVQECKDVMERLKEYAVNYVVTQTEHEIRRRFRKLGDFMYSMTDSRVLGAIGVLSSAALMYKMRSRFMDKMFEATQETQSESVPVPHAVEHRNVWYNDKLQVTPFDISEEGLTMTPEVFKKIIMRATVRIESYHTHGMRPGHAICIGQQLYLANNHCIPDAYPFNMKIFTNNVKSGVCSNVEMVITADCVRRFPDKDLAIINLQCMPPRKDIRKYFCKESFNAIVTCEYPFSTLGDDKKNVVKATQRRTINSDELKIAVDGWGGFALLPTENGDCGKPLILLDKSCQVLGIHVMGGDDGRIIATRVTQEWLATVTDKVLVGPGAPCLQIQGNEIELKDLSPFSPVRWVEKGSAEVYGTLNLPRIAQRSRVHASMIQDDCIDRGYIIEHGPPVLQGWQIWRKNLLNMVDPKFLMRPDVLNVCVLDFLDKIFAGLTPEDLKSVHVVPNDVAINGMPGVAYVDGINRSSSAGFPFMKSKKYFEVPCPTELHPEGITYDENVMQEFERGLNCYKRGERMCPVFNGIMKDEATSIKKIVDFKTRMFAAASLAFVLIVRKYTITVVRLIQNNKFLFECAVGGIAQSTEWWHFRQYLLRYGNNIIAGDYANFDKSMSAMIILAAFQIIIEICRAAGYSLEELIVLRCIAYDTAFAFINFNGDLMMFLGVNPSGLALTVIINCFAGSLYMRYAFYMLRPRTDVVKFNDVVALINYGDDNVQGVADCASWYNHTTIKDELVKYGIVYTMADKEAESVPYISIDESTFLKRHWVWSDEIQSYVGPLEEKSIRKMLMWKISSRTICEELQNVQTFISALNEWFYYGRETFEDNRLWLLSLVDKYRLHYYLPHGLPTWHDMMVSFWERSAEVELTRRGDSSFKPKIEVPLELLHQYGLNHLIDENGQWNKNVLGRSPKSLFSGGSRTLQTGSQQPNSAESLLVVQSKDSNIQQNNDGQQDQNTARDGPVEAEFHEIDFEDYGVELTPEEREYILSRWYDMECVVLSLTDEELEAAIQYLEQVQWDEDYLEIQSVDVQSAVHELNVPSYDLALLIHDELDRVIATFAEHKTKCTTTKLNRDKLRLMLSFLRRLLSLICDSDYRNESFGYIEFYRLCDEFTEYMAAAYDMEDFKLEFPDSLEREFFMVQSRDVERNIDFMTRESNQVDYSGPLAPVHQAQANVDFNDFLKRPVRVASLSYAESNVAGDQISALAIWRDVFSNAYIADKFKTYPFVRGKLHVRFLVNASPFYYGSVLATYCPWQTYMLPTTMTTTNVRELIPLSQRPHVFIEPQNGTQYDMVLPFLHPKEWLNLQSSSEVGNMGTLTLKCMTPLFSANGATGVGVTIAVYAWFDEVEVMGGSVGLSLQSKDIRLSEVASSVADAMGSIPETVTNLVPGYTASQQHISMAGKAAAALGFSNEPITAPGIVTIPRPVPNMASTETPYAFERLTLDPQNNLCVDNAMHNLADNEDELDIQKICAHESYLTQVDWTSAKSADAPLFYAAVNPALFDAEIITVGSPPQDAWQMWMVPCAAVAQMFQYWRGRMRYRFKFICSQYHRGRVQIFYDPAGNTPTVVSAPSQTANMNVVVDISEQNEVVFDVPFVAQTPYLRTRDPVTTLFTTASSATYVTDGAYDSGSIYMRVMNVLTGPVASNTVPILVSVSLLDAEFAGPNDIPAFTHFTVQSKDVYTVQDEMVENLGTKMTHPSASWYMGERIKSLRQVLRRLMLSGTDMGMQASWKDRTALFVKRMTKYPLPYGQASTGIYTANKFGTVATSPCNFCLPTYLNWVMPWFVGVRGSVNWSFVVDGPSKPINMLRIYRQRKTSNQVGLGLLYSTPSAPDWWTTPITSGGQGGTNANFVIKNSYGGAGGMTLTSQPTNWGLNATLPMYSNCKFVFTNPLYITSPIAFDNSNAEVFTFEAFLDSAIDSDVKFNYFCGAGLDFKTVFFLNIPPYQRGPIFSPSN